MEPQRPHGEAWKVRGGERERPTTRTSPRRWLMLMCLAHTQLQASDVERQLTPGRRWVMKVTEQADVLRKTL